MDKDRKNERTGTRNGKGPRMTYVLPPIAFAIIAVIAAWLPIGYKGALPQLASGDPLAVLFGDIRVILGRKFIEKADEYFHGGIKHIHCLDEEAGHAEDDTTHDGHRHAAPAADHAAVPDPWHAISSQVHPPQVDRHLAGQTTKELLPWLWAAAKISQDSVRAYLDAAYVLFALYEQPDKALQALEEGIERNPRSPDLEFMKGNVLTHELDRPGEGEKAFRRALEKSRELDTDDARLLRIRALGYLGVFASKREDAISLRAFWEEARLLNPDHQVTRDLEKRLKACPIAITPGLP